MKSAIENFLTKVGAGEIEVYNEFSLQHELGIYLREAVLRSKVEFERNVCHFNLEKPDFIKKEIDIVLYNKKSDKDKIAIELKYPRNGQVPEQMFSFLKDVQFLEELKDSGFGECYFLALAEDRLFHEGDKIDGIYAYFRDKIKIHGRIDKPTGARDTFVDLKGSYVAEWLPVNNNMKYCLIIV